MDDDAKCENAIGKVKLTYDAASNAVSIDYYDADKHRIQTKTVPTTPLEHLKQEIANCKQASVDCYVAIKTKLDDIRKKLPKFLEIKYSFDKKQVSMYQLNDKKEVSSCSLQEPLDQIVKKIEDLVVTTCIESWSSMQVAGGMYFHEEIKHYSLVTKAAYEQDPENLAHFGVSYLADKQRGVLHFYDHSAIQTAEFDFNSYGGETIKALERIRDIREKDKRASITLANMLRDMLFYGDYRPKFSKLFRDLASGSDPDTIKTNIGDYGFTELLDISKIEGIINIYSLRMTSNPGWNETFREIARQVNYWRPKIEEELKNP